ncbi:MAG: hypothetical protein OHK0012_07390 [Synechococcales cyanobacterium]
MADLIETISYEAGIYQLERTDLVDAGVDGSGVANVQAKQLANRTAWLKEQVEGLDGRVTVLENAEPPLLVSLSQIVTMTAGFPISIPFESVTYPDVAISTRVLAPTLFYCSPVTEPEVRSFYTWIYQSLELEFSYPVLFIYPGGTNTTALPNNVYSALVLQALMDLGPGASDAELAARAEEIGGLDPGDYIIDPASGPLDRVKALYQSRGF